VGAGHVNPEVTEEEDDRDTRPMAPQSQYAYVDDGYVTYSRTQRQRRPHTYTHTKRERGGREKETEETEETHEHAARTL